MTATDDLLLFLFTQYELHNHTELHQLFKLASLCLFPLVKMPVPFVIPIPELEVDEETVKTYVTRALRGGEGKTCFVIGDFLPESSSKKSISRRQSLQVKFESAYKNAIITIEHLCFPKMLSQPAGVVRAAPVPVHPGLLLLGHPLVCRGVLSQKQVKRSCCCNSCVLLVPSLLML